MKKILSVFVLMSCIQIPMSAFGYELTGNDLLKRCDGPYKDNLEQMASKNFCSGYVQGLQQMHHVLIGLYEVAPLYCEPTVTGSYEQLELVIVKWLKKNPEHLHRDARVLVTKALMESFPCK